MISNSTLLGNGRKCVRVLVTVNLCSRCRSQNIRDNGDGFYVCVDCGLCTKDPVLDQEPDLSIFSQKTYERIFYFNERCSRFLCEEPTIKPSCWAVIRREATKPKYGDKKYFTKKTISKILRSIKLTSRFMEKHRSKKFKMTLMTNKRFYDKHFEKWKSIIWKLNGIRPNIPPVEMVELMKRMFLAMQKPFLLYQHVPECDRRYKCHQFFKCWHNFPNYDFVFRKLLQILELKFGFVNCFNLYKNEFSLVSKKNRDEKLRPFFRKIASYNNWPCPNDEV